MFLHFGRALGRVSRVIERVIEARASSAIDALRNAQELVRSNNRRHRP